MTRCDVTAEQSRERAFLGVGECDWKRMKGGSKVAIRDRTQQETDLEHRSFRPEKTERKGNHTLTKPRFPSSRTRRLLSPLRSRFRRSDAPLREKLCAGVAGSSCNPKGIPDRGREALCHLRHCVSSSRFYGKRESRFARDPRRSAPARCARF